MRVLTIKNGEITDQGGINKTIREVNSNLAERGHDCTVITTNTSSLPSTETYQGFQIIRLSPEWEGKLYGINWGAYQYLKKHIRHLDPEVIHVHGYHGLFSPMVMRMIKKQHPDIPQIFSPHFGVFSHATLMGKYLWGTYNRLLGRSIMKIPDLVITASQFEAHNLEEILEVPPQRMRIIPHGINHHNFNPKKGNDGTLNLLYVGYLLELKGVHHIIQALPYLARQDLDFSLRIVGEGPYPAELKKLARKLEVDQYIQWEDFIREEDRLLEYYRNSDVFLLLSQSENYGIVVTEALAMGTPSIVTNRTALKEFVPEPGCFGVDFPPDPEEVARLILDIHQDPVRVGPFSNKIRTWKQVSGDYEEIYTDLGGGS
ncbi:MAG: glycosyltransferase family 4 protein [Methanobacteriaceae archaeon]